MEYKVGDTLVSLTNSGALCKEHSYKVVYTDSTNKLVRLHAIEGTPVPGTFTWGWLNKSVRRVTEV